MFPKNLIDARCLLKAQTPTWSPIYPGHSCSCIDNQKSYCVHEIKSRFASATPRAKPLNSEQQANVTLLVDACLKQGVKDLRQISYVLATAYHESSLLPIEEIGKGKGRPYGEPDKETKKTYYGRGFVQITHKYNYKKFKDILGIDLVQHPEKALIASVAAEITAIGMKEGTFTGKKLDHYFNSLTADPKSARKIINGQDRASMIAGYYSSFYEQVKRERPLIEKIKKTLE